VGLGAREIKGRVPVGAGQNVFLSIAGIGLEGERGGRMLLEEKGDGGNLSMVSPGTKGGLIHLWRASKHLARELNQCCQRKVGITPLMGAGGKRGRVCQDSRTNRKRSTVARGQERSLGKGSLGRRGEGTIILQNPSVYEKEWHFLPGLPGEERSSFSIAIRERAHRTWESSSEGDP